jgi:hypothetical protein
MTTVREFAEGPWRREYGSKPEMDPLTEEDALIEAQVLHIQLDALHSRAAVLFELRLALQLSEGNTGLLVADGVTEFEWRASTRDTARTAWNVVGSAPSAAGGIIEMRLGMLPQAELLIRARSAAFYSGDVGGLREIPDYGTASESELASMLAYWDSDFAPLHAVFIDPNPSARRD